MDVTTRINDPGTGQPFDPTDVLVKVVPPTGSSFMLRYSTGEVSKVDVGRYRFSINTALAPGVWKYQVSATGGDAVVKQRHLRVVAQL